MVSRLVRTFTLLLVLTAVMTTATHSVSLFGGFKEWMFYGISGTFALREDCNGQPGDVFGFAEIVVCNGCPTAYIPQCAWVEAKAYQVNQDVPNPGRWMKMMVEDFDRPLTDAQRKAGEPEGARMIAESKNGMALRGMVKADKVGSIAFWLGTRAKIRGERDKWIMIPLYVVPISIEEWIANGGGRTASTPSAGAATTQAGVPTTESGVLDLENIAQVGVDTPSPASPIPPVSSLVQTEVNVDGQTLTIKVLDGNDTAFTGSGCVMIFCGERMLGQTVIDAGRLVKHGTVSDKGFSGTIRVPVGNYRDLTVKAIGFCTIQCSADCVTIKGR